MFRKIIFLSILVVKCLALSLSTDYLAREFEIVLQNLSSTESIKNLKFVQKKNLGKIFGAIFLFKIFIK